MKHSQFSERGMVTACHDMLHIITAHHSYTIYIHNSTKCIKDIKKGRKETSTLMNDFLIPAL